MKTPEYTRSEDEIHLSWLNCRSRGWSAGKIASRAGVHKAHVELITDRIMNADLAAGARDLVGSYW